MRPDLPVLPGPASRLRRGLGSARRAVLARRRLLAGLCAALAVAGGLRATAAPVAQTEPVLVAARDLAPGEPVGPDDLVEAAYAAGTAPDDLAEDPVGRVLAAPLRRGEPVTDVRLVGADLAAGHPGRVALPLRLPDAAMAALLRPGDRIDLVAADPQGGEPEVVAQRVPVLALPSPDDAAPQGGGSGRLVVVAARESEVAAITDAAVRRYLAYAFSEPAR